MSDLETDTFRQREEPECNCADRGWYGAYHDTECPANPCNQICPTCGGLGCVSKCQACIEEGHECGHCAADRMNQERRKQRVATAESLLLQCPDLPDDFHYGNKDAVEAFEHAFREWKERIKIPNPTTICPACLKEAKWKHMHDSPHALSGAHMAGTERFECSACGHKLFKKEGEKHGLKFTLD